MYCRPKKTVLDRGSAAPSCTVGQQTAQSGSEICIK